MSDSKKCQLRLLVIVAHPHDFTHMAGTCAHHLERGDSVKLIALTGGLKIHNEDLHRELRKPPDQRDMNIVSETDDQYAQRKEHEMNQAARLFGITDAHVWPFPDNPLEPAQDVIAAVTEVLLDYRPHLLLTHAPYIEPNRGRYYAYLSDHVAAGVAVLRAQHQAGTPDRQSMQRPHQVASVYYMAAEFDRTQFDLVIDITDQAHHRLEAEKLFKSQAQSDAFARKRIEHRALYDGWAGGYAYGESFIRARHSVDRHLPLSDEELRLSELSSADSIEQISYKVTDDPALHDDGAT